MVVLRCTSRLLSHLKSPPIASPSKSTTRLGDWYAHLLILRPARLIICVSERTLLPVIIPAKEIGKFPERLNAAVGDALRQMGIANDLVSAELEQMKSSVFSKTTSRRVLGSLNDFVRMLEAFDRIEMPLSEISKQLSLAPCSPLGMESPDRATPLLFKGQPTLRVIK